jgi:hypothetical protein
LPPVGSLGKLPSNPSSATRYNLLWRYKRLFHRSLLAFLSEPFGALEEKQLERRMPLFAVPILNSRLILRCACGVKAIRMGFDTFLRESRMKP